MKFAQIPTIVSADFARFVAASLSPELVRKNDLIKCLKALGVKTPEILNLRAKDDLWIQLQLASVANPKSA